MAPRHTIESVLGDFSGATFDYHGVTSRFFRKDGKFFVETDGPDGKLATFEIKYTFGVDPLQQYLIEFPDGRIQALSIAWDSRPKDKGGQRWFHLYPERGHPPRRRAALDQAEPELEFHVRRMPFDRRAQELRCGDRSLRNHLERDQRRLRDLSRNRIATMSRGRATSRAGGRSASAKTAPRASRFASTNAQTSPGRQTRRPASRSAVFAPALLRTEVETCGFCHARRRRIFGGLGAGSLAVQYASRVAIRAADSFMPTARPATSRSPITISPFKQSAMFAAGVTCSDCHEPHSAALRAPGNGVCVQCHAADKFDTVAHRHHDDVKPALACTSCHMQARDYMIVDPRHDHSFRVPRPDLSVKLGTPNACNNCHRDQSPQWAAAAVERWHGPNRIGFQNYAEAFHAAWTEQPDAEKLLAAVASNGNTPAYVRAGALAELNAFVSPANLDLARKGLADPDPMVRIGALDMLEGIQVEGLWPLLSPLLSDSVRGVRLRAVSLLAAVPASRQPPADRDRFDRAAAEFIAAQRFNADRPEARTALGAFYARRGNTDRGRNGIYRRPAAKPAVCARGDQSCRSLSAARARR